MRFLLLLFIVVPAIEVTLLAQVVGWLGGLNTLLIVVLTGIVGAALAKRQGLGILRQLQQETASGQLPAGALVDGVIVLLAGALLVTPGVLTDAVGFLCLVPRFRDVVKAGLDRYVRHLVEQNQLHIHHAGPQRPTSDQNPLENGPIIDVGKDSDP